MADRRLLMIGIAATVGVLLGGGIYLTQQSAGDRYAQCRQGVVAGGLDSFGTDFTLTRADGQRVTNEQVFDKPSLLYFGYTFCPDVCPLDTARNAEVVDILQQQGHDIQSVFITVDPRRDTPQVLADYASLFSDDMIALTGSDDEIAAVNRGWRNVFQRHDQEDKEFYLVDHMTHSYLVMPGTETVEFFRRDAEAEPMAERVGCFMNARG
ncbi:SCO family protein [Paracoccus sp. (in: a-proteobacteria)]|uniref:SCO family protein n=1 Tax=Paracoccus sp. TaxID=267 RepID=UPI0026E020EF|nr:SCO family protein [Paracoccus sp. (in: a-proteobacteria)]MDO5648339.1 SCO family protein [Paracoccus sp. (in: a-proteobacteria)]